MKDKNGIEIKCENCDDFIPVGTNGRGCTLYEEDCENVFGGKRCVFKASSEALEARIADLEKKLTETIKLLGERSRECGELGWWVVEILAIFLLLSVATIFFIKTTEGKGKEDGK